MSTFIVQNVNIVKKCTVIEEKIQRDPRYERFNINIGLHCGTIIDSNIIIIVGNKSRDQRIHQRTSLNTEDQKITAIKSPSIVHYSIEWNLTRT